MYRKREVDGVVVVCPKGVKRKRGGRHGVRHGAHVSGAVGGGCVGNVVFEENARPCSVWCLHVPVYRAAGVVVQTCGFVYVATLNHGTANT